MKKVTVAYLVTDEGVRIKVFKCVEDAQGYLDKTMAETVEFSGGIIEWDRPQTSDPTYLGVDSITGRDFCLMGLRLDIAIQ